MLLFIHQMTSLQNNVILAAGLDVYVNEPNIPKELIDLKNTVLLPHVASATVETRNAMGQLVFDNIENFFEGKRVFEQKTRGRTGASWALAKGIKIYGLVNQKHC